MAVEYLKVADIAVVLGCSERTVRRVIERGELPVIRFGPRLTRVAPGDLAAFIGKSHSGADPNGGDRAA